MPLTASTSRNEVHTRNITLRGYQRDDGLFDIEGHLTDSKPYSLDMEQRGLLEPNEPIHDMWMRMTINPEMVIVSCEAVTEKGPYRICPDAAPNFASLAGLSIKPGFLREAAERIGGVHGCTHLREMLQQMGTVAFQSMYSLNQARPPREPKQRPALIDSCYAFAANGEQVKRRWPQFFTGPVDDAP